MDEIERRRHSNIAGTAEQRRAQQNQASLSAWTSMLTIMPLPLQRSLTNIQFKF